MKIPLFICDWVMRTWVPRSFDTPYSDLPDYMERSWLVPYARKTQLAGDGSGPVTWQRPIAKVLQFFGIAVRVHHILCSDDEGAYHDHPWRYLTLILRGGYAEHRPVFDQNGLYTADEAEWIAPGRVVTRPAKSWHRLVLPQGETTWTLFVTFKYQQRWGFLIHPQHKLTCSEYVKRFGKDSNQS